MKKALTIALFALVSCASTTINTSAIRDTTQVVVERHDVYCADDQDALRQSATLLVLVAAAEVSKQDLAVPLLPVTERHDMFVIADVTLTPLEKRVYLRSSSELVRLLE